MKFGCCCSGLCSCLAAMTTLADISWGLDVVKNQTNIIYESPNIPVSADIPAGDNCREAQELLKLINGAESELAKSLSNYETVKSDCEQSQAQLNKEQKKIEEENLKISRELSELSPSRNGKKFMSARELLPEKLEFIDLLDKDVALIDGIHLSRKSICTTEKISVAFCNQYSTDIENVLRSAKVLLDSRKEMLLTLRDCAAKSLRFFDCHVSDRKCPASTLICKYIKDNELESVFQGVWSNIHVKSDADICRFTHDQYEGVLEKYRKKYMGSNLTNEAINKVGLNQKNNVELANAKERLAGLKMQLATQEKSVAQCNSKLKNLQKQYSDSLQACSDQRCSPEIMLDQTEWKITPEPSLASIIARSNAVGEWTFQSTWEYNKEKCAYPQTVTPFSGSYINATRYVKQELFGGTYKFSLKTKCGDTTKEVVRSGKISGQNPARESIKAEILKDAGEANLEILMKIACYESGIHQFCEGTDPSCHGAGMPYAGNPADFGIFQITTDAAGSNAKHCRTAWDWKYNVQFGVDLWTRAVRNSKNHNVSEMQAVSVENKTDKVIFNKELQLCVIAGIKESVKKLNLPPDMSTVILGKLTDALVDINKMSDKNSAIAKDLKKIGVEDRLINELFLNIEKYYPPPLDDGAQLRDAIRRFNGGRENHWEPFHLNKVTGKTCFSKDDYCNGVWIRRPKLTTKPKYVDRVMEKSADCPVNKR